MWYVFLFFLRGEGVVLGWLDEIVNGIGFRRGVGRFYIMGRCVLFMWG